MRSENFTISKYVGIILLRLENYQAMLWINIAQFHHLDLSFLPRYLVGSLDYSCGNYLRTTTKRKTLL